MPARAPCIHVCTPQPQAPRVARRAFFRRGLWKDIMIVFQECPYRNVGGYLFVVEWGKGG